MIRHSRLAATVGRAAIFVVLSLLFSGRGSLNAQVATAGGKAAKRVADVLAARDVKQGTSAEELGTPIAAGQRVTATFAQDGPSLGDGSRYHRYSYAGRAGERVTILMTSGDFASYLYLGQSVGGEMREIARDDGTAGRDAHIALQLPADGRYVIVTNAYEPNVVGTYTLLVTSTAPAGPTDWATRYPGGGDPGERYALLVGIADYPATNNDLDGPVEDARIMRDVLINKYGFDPRNIVLITDTDANRETISNAFVRHLGQAGRNGVAVFYFSGHGTQTAGNYGVQPPLDPEPDSKDEALVLWGSDRKSSLLLDDELGFMIDGLGAGRTLIVLDACYSGTATRRPGVQPKRVRLARSELQLPSQFLVDRRGRATSAAPRAVAGAVRPNIPRAAAARARAGGTADILRDPVNHVLLTASADNELSYTADGWPSRGGVASVMTYYLADAMEADDGTATIAAIAARVRDLSVRFSRANFGAAQTPQVEGARKNETLASFLAKR